MTCPLLQSTWAQLWCVILMIAFHGWGRMALGRLALQDTSSGLAVCVGISLALFTGAILNFLHLITPGTLLGFAVLGVALTVFQMTFGRPASPPMEVSSVLQTWRGTKRWGMVVLALFVILFLFRTTSSTRAFQYLLDDDENFYLAMPVKIMQTHHFAADPYSERRVESSLGGSYFLQCLLLSALPLQNVQMADRFIGAVLIVLFVLVFAQKFEMSSLETCILGIFSVVLTPFDFNLTFTVLPSAIILAMVWLAMGDDLTARPAISNFLVGLMAGSLCVLKSTSVPFAGLFCLIFCARAGTGRFWAVALKGWLAALLGVLVIMAPWMIAMRLTSGTFLYPLLGSGYDFSAYHQFPMPFLADPIKIFRQGAPFIVFLSLVVFAQLCLLKREKTTVLLITTTSCLIAIIVTAFATGGDDSQRYNFCIVLPTMLLIFVQFSREIQLRPSWMTGHFLRMAAAGFILAYIYVHAIRGQYKTMWKEVGMCLSGGSMESSETRIEYAKISAAIPKDSRILATLQDPYLLAPLDERVLLADFPGCAGPPPGWPIKQDGEALANYLLGHSIRYLAYSYKGNAQLDYCRTVDMTHKSIRSHIQYGAYLLADKQYLQLKRTRKTIYDDGKVFILDLSAMQIGSD